MCQNDTGSVAAIVVIKFHKDRSSQPCDVREHYHRAALKKIM